MIEKINNNYKAKKVLTDIELDIKNKKDNKPGNISNTMLYDLMIMILENQTKLLEK